MLDRPARAADRVWRYGEGHDRVADVYWPPTGSAGRAPVVLVHGGYWRPEYDRTHLRPMAEALAAAGHPVLLVGYSRIPGTPDATLADLRCALADAAQVLRGRPPVLVGHSAGGHLALVLAADPGTTAAACLALAPVADLCEAERLALDDGAARAFLGTAAAERPDLDPRRLTAPRIPVTVVHGEADTLVPPALSAGYAHATGARHVPLPGTGHFEVIDPASDAWSTVIAELSALAAAAGIE